MADFLVIARVVGCSIAAILSLFLATLAWRSQKKGRGVRILYATCALVFSICGVMNGAFALIGTLALADTTGMLRLTAAALWPMSAIGMWLDDDGLSTRRRQLGTLLFRCAIVSAGLIVLVGGVTVWVVPRLHADATLRDVLLMHRVHGAASYNSFSAIAAGVWLLVRKQDQGRFQQFSVWTMLTGLSIGAACIVTCTFSALPPSIRSLVMLMKEQAVTLILIGSLLYFARFRAVDVFLKLSLRLFAGVALALIAAGLALGPIQSMAAISTAPVAASVIGYTALTGLLLLLVQRVWSMTDAVVARYMVDCGNIKAALPSVSQRLEHVVARKLDRLLLLDPAEILFFYMENGMVRAKTSTETFWVNHQMGELEAGLAAANFFRAHRSTLVNLKTVREIRPDGRTGFVLVMADSTQSQIDVSERQARLLRARIPGL